ncbi:MAG: hypothetical protein HQK51_00580 [Oligoflexia bacterium]|nr:hypothetical protein [Oligoflexia bacterium]
MYLNKYTHIDCKKILFLKKFILTLLVISTVIITLFSITSCSNYKFKRTTNPLAPYGVNTVSIPMFLNKSSVPNVSGPITRTIINSLLQYPDLKVYAGDWKKCDGILIGIITSSPTISGALASGGSGEIKPGDGTIGNRRSIIVPTATTINLTLTLTLIKDPTHKDFDFIISTLGKYIYNHPKAVFTESIGMTGTIGRVNDTGIGTNSSVVTNFTKNRGMQDKVIHDMAEQAATNFRNIILYAF